MLLIRVPLNEGRGINPGDTCVGLALLPDNACTLNEGRGINPGDTPRGNLVVVRYFLTLNEGRGINPGDTSLTAEIYLQGTPALNEGRGINPGDTYSSVAIPAFGQNAQRRPGHKPRRHLKSKPTGLLQLPARSTKAGA